VTAFSAPSHPGGQTDASHDRKDHGQSDPPAAAPVPSPGLLDQGLLLRTRRRGDGLARHPHSWPYETCSMMATNSSAIAGRIAAAFSCSGTKRERAIRTV
jgi:hypothetical protein